MRRRLGSSAWCALEVLVSSAGMTADGVAANASVRSLAAELAVATNTAQRALKTLRAVGLIEHHQHRGTAGRFQTTTYRVNVGRDVLVLAAAVADEPLLPSLGDRIAVVSPPQPKQLSSQLPAAASQPVQAAQLSFQIEL